MSENNSLEIESVQHVPTRTPQPVAGMAVAVAAVALLVAAYAVYRTRRWA